MGELVVYQLLHNLQTSLKQLGQTNGDSLKWEQKFVQMVLVKKLKNLFLQNQKASDLECWYVALEMWDLPSLFK